MDLTKITDKLIFVNIKESYQAMMNNDQNNSLYRPNRFECTRKYWRVKYEKAQAATHILGCYQGKVVEVIKIDKFHTVPDGELKGRRIFEGEEEIASPYLGWDIHELFELRNFQVRYLNI